MGKETDTFHELYNVLLTNDSRFAWTRNIRSVISINNDEHVPSLWQVGDDASRVGAAIVEVHDGMADGLLVVAWVGTGRSSGGGGGHGCHRRHRVGRRRRRRCAVARVVGDAQRRVLMEIVGPAAVQRLPVAVRQQPGRVAATTAVGLHCTEHKASARLNEFMAAVRRSLRPSGHTTFCMPTQRLATQRETHHGGTADALSDRLHNSSFSSKRKPVCILRQQTEPEVEQGHSLYARKSAGSRMCRSIERGIKTRNGKTMNKSIRRGRLENGATPRSLQ